MPDILSHLICANESTKFLSSEINDIIIANKTIFNLGAQGPDLFFYYKVYPWQDSGKAGEYADLIHSNCTNAFFINGANILKQEIAINQLELFKSEDKKTETHKKFAYLAGFLTHYSLDTICHPYIFYHSGINSSHNHKYLECIIDTMISKIYNAKKEKLKKTAKAITLKEYERDVISRFLCEVVDKTYNVEIPSELIRTSMKDMKSVMSMMYDPFSVKKTGLSAIDKASKLNGKIVTARFPAKLRPDVDYLNLNHKKWCHPCDDKIIYNTSFLDLYKEAILYSYNLIMNLSLYLINSTSANTFKTLIGNRLYDTGLDASLNQEMKFDGPILDYKVDFKLKK